MQIEDELSSPDEAYQTNQLMSEAMFHQGAPSASSKPPAEDEAPKKPEANKPPTTTTSLPAERAADSLLV